MFVCLVDAIELCCSINSRLSDLLEASGKEMMASRKREAEAVEQARKALTLAENVNLAKEEFEQKLLIIQESIRKEELLRSATQARSTEVGDISQVSYETMKQQIDNLQQKIATLESDKERWQKEAKSLEESLTRMRTDKADVDSVCVLSRSDSLLLFCCSSDSKFHASEAQRPSLVEPGVEAGGGTPHTGAQSCRAKSNCG